LGDKSSRDLEFGREGNSEIRDGARLKRKIGLGYENQNLLRLVYQIQKFGKKEKEVRLQEEKRACSRHS